jgi:hypothetical protein
VTADKPTARPVQRRTEPPWALHEAITNDPVHVRDYRTANQPAHRGTRRTNHKGQ